MVVSCQNQIIPNFARTHNSRIKSCRQNIGITPPKIPNLFEIWFGGPSGGFCFAKSGIIFVFVVFYILLFPPFCLADPQLLTDAELEEITVSSLPDNFANPLINELEKSLNNSLSSMRPILNLDYFSSGLTQVNGSFSTVIIQTNVTFFLNSYGVDINQSNTALLSH